MTEGSEAEVTKLNPCRVIDGTWHRHKVTKGSSRIPVEFRLQNDDQVVAIKPDGMTEWKNVSRSRNFVIILAGLLRGSVRDAACPLSTRGGGGRGLRSEQVRDPDQRPLCES